MKERRLHQEEKRSAIVEGYRGGLSHQSVESVWKWCEQNIRISEGAFPGRYRTERTPMVRFVYDCAQNRATRRITGLVSAQSAKTITALNLLGYVVVNSPATVMWITASKDSCEEFLRKRLEPHFLDSPGLAEHWPLERQLVSQRMIRFRTCNVLLRGSNSKIGLKSDPVRFIFCDERSDWPDYAIDMVRKRLRTFANSLEFSFGTSGDEHNALHRDFEDGSQTVFRWRCPGCDHPQAFRFGKEAGPIWKAERTLGGIVWETSERTKPEGVWNYEEVAKTVRYECESCGRLFEDHEKHELIADLEPYHLNPSAFPRNVSFHWSALYMPWVDTRWPSLVIEFLKAKQALKRGDIAPLKSFVTETLGEPWRQPSESVQVNDLLKRRAGYKMGEDPKERDPKAEQELRIMTVDVQMGYFVLVVRAYRNGGGSRLILADRVIGWEGVLEVQQLFDITPQCVFVDVAYNRHEVKRECLRNGWSPMEGDEHASFIQPDPIRDEASGRMMKVRAPWTWKDEDAEQGTNLEGKFVVTIIVWSNPSYMERLYLYTMKGLAQPWEIPYDIPGKYVEEVMAYERLTETDENGRVSYSWTHRGRRHDFADCELMQCAAADRWGVTKTEVMEPADDGVKED